VIVCDSYIPADPRQEPRTSAPLAGALSILGYPDAYPNLENIGDDETPARADDVLYRVKVRFALAEPDTAA
jgi:hypothetical protein